MATCELDAKRVEQCELGTGQAESQPLMAAETAQGPADEAPDGPTDLGGGRDGHGPPSLSRNVPAYLITEKFGGSTNGSAHGRERKGSQIGQE